MVQISDHPYIACLLAFLFGLAAEWIIGTFMDWRRENERHEDADEITGIGA